MLRAARNVFLHIAQGDYVLGARQQASNVIGVLFLGHLDLLCILLLPQGIVAEQVVVHLTGGLPAHQQAVLRALEQLQALWSHHCKEKRNKELKIERVILGAK